MVNVVLSSKLHSQMETACQIDFLCENGTAEVKINNACEKRGFEFY